MTTDPSSLFIAAALAAGLVEGSSVARYHRRALQLQQQANDGDDHGSVGGKNNDNDDASVPSMPMLAAHSIVYGIVSVPLGIVGASPGFAFMPKSALKCDDGNSVVMETKDAMNETEAAGKMVEDVEPDRLPSDVPSTAFNTPVVGTGRGAGRMLRQENSNKMAQTKRHRQLEIQAASRNKTAGSSVPGTAVIKPSTYNSISSRYIATLDGTPLPTRLAEAMRRSRCMFIGAAMVSYAITHCLSEKQRERENDHNLNTTYSCGYGHWMNNKSISLWNERIKHGKSFDEAGILKQLQTNLIAQQEMGDSAFQDMLSKILSDENYAKTQELLSSVVYNATKWINLQLLGLDLDEPPFSLIRHWNPTFGESETINSDSSKSVVEKSDMEGNVVDRGGAEDIDVKHTNVDATTDSPSDSEQSQKSSNALNVAVTSIDVLGTSIRHLLASPYRVAAVVVGRKKRMSPEDGGADALNENGKDPVRGDLGNESDDGNSNN